MHNRPRSRRPGNDSQRARPDGPGAAFDWSRLSALGAWTGSLRRRLRALGGPFKAARRRPGAKPPQGAKSALPVRLLRKVGTLFSVFIAVVVVTVLLSEVFSRDKVVIRPFLVNPELQGIYDDQAVAHLIKHNILVMIHEAKSNKKEGGFDLPVSTRLPDVQVPAANISVRSLMRYVQEFFLIRYFRRLFGINPIEVDGEALLRGDRVTITVRLTREVDGGLVVEPRTFTGKREQIEPLIEEVSQFIMAYAEPYLWAAYLYQKRRTDEALAQIQYCLRREPAESRHMALALWGLILIDEERYEEAKDKLEEATKHVPAGREGELATAYNNWGLALLYQCKHDDAILKFEEAIRHDAKHAPAYVNYGSALLSRSESKSLGALKSYDEEEKRKAVEKLEEAMSLDPSLAQAYYDLALVRHDEGTYADAVALYLEAIRLNPEYVEAYSSLGLLLGDSLTTPRPGEAIEKLDTAIGLDKSYAPAYANRALARANKRDYKGAIVDLELAVKLYEELSAPRRGCGNFTRRHARAYNNLGWAYEKDGNYAKAVANYQRAVDLDPEYYYAYTGKGDALREDGRLGEALDAYAAALRAPKEDELSRFTAYEGKALTLFERARAGGAGRRSDLEASVSMWEEAEKLRPDSEDVREGLSKARDALKSLLGTKQPPRDRPPPRN